MMSNSLSGAILPDTRMLMDVVNDSDKEGENRVEILFKKTFPNALRVKEINVKTDFINRLKNPSIETIDLYEKCIFKLCFDKFGIQEPNRCLAVAAIIITAKTRHYKIGQCLNEAKKIADAYRRNENWIEMLDEFVKADPAEARIYTLHNSSKAQKNVQSICEYIFAHF